MDASIKSLYEDKTYKRLAELAKIRQSDITSSCNQIDRHARSLSRTAAVLRVVIIILGAFVATNGIPDDVVKDLGLVQNIKAWVKMAFTAFGVLIAIAAGLEGFFKFEKNGAALKALASKCQSFSRQFMAEFDLRQDPNNYEVTINSLKELVRIQNEKLNEVQKEAADLGLTLVIQKYDIEP